MSPFHMSILYRIFNNFSRIINLIRLLLSSNQPRLGPKPFSSNSGDVSFDKVFAVPVAPGSQENIHHASTAGGTADNNGGDNFVPPAAPTPTATTAQSKPDLIVEIEIKSKLRHLLEFPRFLKIVYLICFHLTEPNTDNAGDGNVQKTLSTSERRKVC